MLHVHAFHEVRDVTDVS